MDIVHIECRRLNGMRGNFIATSERCCLLDGIGAFEGWVLAQLKMTRSVHAKATSKPYKNQFSPLHPFGHEHGRKNLRHSGYQLSHFLTIVHLNWKPDRHRRL